MATHPTPLEPEDVLDLPLPNGVSGYELVDGQPVPVSPASWQHGSLIVEVAHRLANFIEANGLGGRVVSNVGFVLALNQDPRRLRGPDVAYVTEEKLRGLEDPGSRFARFIPDLMVEIDLGSPKKPGGQQRIRDYLEAGVPLIWAIDPRKRSAMVYRGDGTMTEIGPEEALDGEAVIPGFGLPLAALFR